MDDVGMEFLLDAVDMLDTSDLQSFSAIFSVFSLTRHGRRRCRWILMSPLHEEFADSHEQPDPVPMSLLVNSGPGVALPAESDFGYGCGQQIGVEDNNSTRAGVRRRHDSSPTRSAHHLTESICRPMGGQKGTK